jgi:hypothetical protein
MKNTKMSVTRTGADIGSEERARRAANYAAAQRHVGGDNLKQLSWLVDLVNAPPDQLRENLLDSCSVRFYEIFLFSNGPRGGWDIEARLEPEPKKLVGALAAIRAFLESIVDTGAGRLQTGPRNNFACTPFDAPTRNSVVIPGRLDYTYETEELHEALLARAFDVVVAEGNRLARCDAVKCGRLFLRRKRAIFCSGRCALKERQRSWRERQHFTDHREGTNNA